FSQSETERRTHDTLEAVHSTLGHVVDRLAMIEGDLRNVRAAPAPEQSPAQPAPFFAEAEPEAPRMSMPAMPGAELPNPAASQTQFAASAPQEHFIAAPREFHAATSEAPEAQMPPELPSAMPVTPRAISEILLPLSTPRAALEPDLPPDHPL